MQNLSNSSSIACFIPRFIPYAYPLFLLFINFAYLGRLISFLFLLKSEIYKEKSLLVCLFNELIKSLTML